MLAVKRSQKCEVLTLLIFYFLKNYLLSNGLSFLALLDWNPCKLKYQ